MKIGLIGATGGIAAKAYLPVYAALQGEHEFTVYSRELAKAEHIRSKYNFAKATQILANLDLSDLVFIHAATIAHFELAKHFLNAGVHVVLDKPISENLVESKALLDLAAAKNRLFIVAFNRRFLPATQQLKALPGKTFVKITKNVLPCEEPVKFSLYDKFIHPLDTLIYLLTDKDEKDKNEEIVKFDYQLVAEADRLKRVLVWLYTPTTTGFASMNQEAGAWTEEFTVEAKFGTLRVTDLADVVKFEGQKILTGHFHGWEPTTYTRGFDNIVNSAIDAVAKFDSFAAKYPQKSSSEISQALRQMRQTLLGNLHQKNILKSHEIIAELLAGRQ